MEKIIRILFLTLKRKTLSKPRQHDPNFKSTLGLKQSHAVTNMPAGALLDVLNMNLDGLGGKTTRRGYLELFHLTNGVGAARVNDRILNLFQYRPRTGSSRILAYAGERIYARSLTTTTETEVVRSGVLADTYWSFAQYNNFVHGVNGNNTSLLYNGTDAITISITAPTTHVTLADGGTGTLSAGTYNYVVTFYDNDRARESDAFSIATAPGRTVGANGAVTISNLPTVTSGEGVTHYRIYRRGPSETNYTRTATIASSSTSYTDSGDATGTSVINTDDGTTDVVAFTAHPQSNLIISAFDRVFMVPTATPSVVRYSLNGGRSFAWPTGNTVALGRDDGSPVRYMELHDESIIFHKGNSKWRLSGNPATTSPVRFSNRGIQGARLSTSINNKIFTLTPHGFYKSEPTPFSSTDLREEYIGKDISVDESLIDWQNTDSAHICSYDGNDSRHIYAMFPNNATYSTRVLVYDYFLEEWIKYQLATDVFSCAQYEESGRQRLMLGDGYGMVWEWDIGNTDGINLPSSELNGTATGGSSITLEDTTQSWDTNELIGLQVFLRGGTGNGQVNRIISNTATAFTVFSSWATNPSTDTTYSIARINKFAEEFWNDNQAPHMLKRMRWVRPYIQQTVNDTVTLSFRKNFKLTPASTQTKDLNLASSEALFDVNFWDVAVWDESRVRLPKIRLGGKYKYYSIRYENNLSAQGFTWNGHQPCYQILYDKSA